MDDQALERVQLGSREADAEAKQLRTRLETVDKWRRLLASVLDHADDRPALTNVTLSRAQDLIRSRETTDAETVSALRSIWQECQQRARAAAADSVRGFPEAAESAGLQIDKSSRHPRYTFDEHFITVELLERDLLAKVEIRHGDRPHREPLDIPAVVTRVKDEQERLFQRPWKPQIFFQSLEAAYRDLADEQDGVTVRDLAKTIAGSKKPRLDEFAVDLGRLLRDREAVGERVRITTNHTRDTARGLLLHGLEQGGYVLTLKIEEV